MSTVSLRVPRPLRTAAVALALVALSGCQAVLTTEITVHSATSADIRVSVVFTGEAADVVAADRDSRNLLVRLVTDAAGTEPDVTIEDQRVEIAVAVPYDRLAAAAELTGISAAAIAYAGEDQAQVSATLVRPARIDRAIEDTIATRPDASAVRTAMTGSTTLAVSVVFPGDVTAVSAPEGATVERDGNRVAITQTLGSFRPGELSVTGSTAGSSLSWPLLAVVVAVVGAVLLAVRRRR